DQPRRCRGVEIGDVYLCRGVYHRDVDRRASYPGQRVERHAFAGDLQPFLTSQQHTQTGANGRSRRDEEQAWHRQPLAYVAFGVRGRTTRLRTVVPRRTTSGASPPECIESVAGSESTPA